MVDYKWQISAQYLWVISCLQAHPERESTPGLGVQEATNLAEEGLVRTLGKLFIAF